MAGAKEQRWYQLAEELVVIKGYSYDQVIAHVARLGDGISKGTLTAWSKKGDWQSKRDRYLLTARGLAPELERQLKEKARLIMADAGKLDLAALKEMNAMLRLIQGMGKQGPDLRIQALEVMGRFAQHVREHAEDNFELETVDRLVGSFMSEVERMAA